MNYIEDNLVSAINDPSTTRLDIAKLYKEAFQANPQPDWARVNLEIMNRWSKSALVWIKTEAWG